VSQWWRVIPVLPLLLALAACAETIYSDADEGTTRELGQGSSFGVSLPVGASPAERSPKIEGALVRYLGRSLQEDKSREIYRFRADGAGEALIRIPSDGPPSEPPAFVIRLRITPAGTHHPVGPFQTQPAQSRPY
jgi:hypothetical protein